MLKHSALAKRQVQEDEDALEDSTVPAAADFQMFAALLALLLKRASWLASSGGSGSEGTEPLAATVRCGTGLRYMHNGGRALTLLQCPGSAGCCRLPLVGATPALARSCRSYARQQGPAACNMSYRSRSPRPPRNSQFVKLAAIRCRAMACLAAPLKSCRVYRPTQDPGGAHRAVLQRLADTVLALAAQQHSGGSGGSSAGSRMGSSKGSVGAAVLEVVQGVLAVEHRPIQEHLTALWALLLAPQTLPSALAAAESPAAAAAAGGGGRSVHQGASSAAAVAVAAGLIGAYAELRQLEVLLASLAHALLGSNGAAGHGGQAAAAASPDAAAAAAAVVCSGEFEGSLCEAVQGLPSGQAAAVVRWVAGELGLLSGRDSSDPMVTVFSEASSQNSMHFISLSTVSIGSWASPPMPAVWLV